METFASYDGTMLAYNVYGEGEPLVCVPGGPGRAGEYLGTLGGLDAYRQLIVLDNRGTGGSAIPSDPETFRADRLVADVEALRAHLSMESIDLLGHSAGAHVALLYALAHPERIRRLLLITGGQRAVGADVPGAFLRQAEVRAEDPLYADALPAIKGLLAAETAEETYPFLRAAAPMFYGRPFSEAARAHFAAGERKRNEDAAEGFHVGLVTDVEANRAAARALDAPVLVCAGDADLGPTVPEATTLTGFFPQGELVVQPNAGHYPWVDDPAWFSAAVSTFLSR